MPPSSFPLPPPPERNDVAKNGETMEICSSGDGGEDQPGQRGGGERDRKGVLGLHAGAAHGGYPEVVKGTATPVNFLA